MGAGSSTPIIISSYSITSNVVSFVTQQQINPLVAGQTVVLSNFDTGTYFNNQTVTVLSTGLSLTTFQANFTHVNVSSTPDIGSVTPTTQYASSAAYNYITPSAGQNVLYVRPVDIEPAPQHKNGNFFGTLWSLVTGLRSLYGIEGSNFSIIGFTLTSGKVPLPTLPFGATVVGIYPCAIGTFRGNPSTFISFSADWSDLTTSPPTPSSYQFALSGLPEHSPTSIGTNLALIPTLSFSNFSEANAGASVYWDVIQDFCVGVVYTLPSGAPIPPLRLQTLAATKFNFAIPAHTVATGVKASFSTGTNPISITNYSISSNVATFTTQTAVTVGQTLTLSNFATGTYFNNQTLTVLAGATATSFTAAFTHADVGSTADVGLAAPIAATLTAQLTLNGKPIGQPKTLTTSSWTTTYTLGDDGDLWGTAAGDLTDITINGTAGTGLGINISGTLPVGSQINLNNVQLQVFTIYKLTLPSFALIATYSTSGDTSTTPSADLVSIPGSTTAFLPVTLLWNTANIVQIEITANNGIDAPIDTGLVNTQGSGVYTLTAGLSKTTTFTMNAYDTIGHIALTPTTTVNITPVLTSISLSPTSAALVVGGTQQFVTTGHYSDGTTAPISLGVSYISSNPSQVAVDSSGLALAMAAGTPTVTASYHGFTTSPAVVTVTAPPSFALTQVGSYSGLLGYSLRGWSTPDFDNRIIMWDHSSTTAWMNGGNSSFHGGGQFQSFALNGSSLGSVTPLPTDQSDIRQIPGLAMIGMDKGGNIYFSAIQNSTSNTLTWKTDSTGAILGSINHPPSWANGTPLHGFIMYHAGSPYIVELGNDINGDPTQLWIIDATTMTTVNTFTLPIQMSSSGQYTSPIALAANPSGTVFVTMQNSDSGGDFSFIPQNELFTCTFAGVTNRYLPWPTNPSYNPRALLGTQGGNLVVFNDDTSISLVKSSNFNAEFSNVPAIGLYWQGPVIVETFFNYGLTAADDTFISYGEWDGTGNTPVLLVSGVDLSIVGSSTTTLPYNGGDNMYLQYLPESRNVVQINAYHPQFGSPPSDLRVYSY